MAINHKLRAKQAWPILVKAAQQQLPPLTYGQLCGMIGLHHRSARWFLGVIQTYCSQNGLPPLQSLAVNKKTGVPGIGYIGSGRSKGQHKRAVNRVYKWGKKWQLKPPKF